MAKTEVIEKYGERNEKSFYEAYVNLRTTENSILSRKEWAIFVFICVTLYLINGTYAKVLCNLLTSVPAAAFTYKVLISGKTTTEGYHAILFFWSLNGTMTVCDVAFTDTTGYYFGKFILLAIVSGHAFLCNKGIFENHTEMDETQNLTTIISRYDSQGYAIDTPVCSQLNSGNTQCTNSIISAVGLDTEIMSTQHISSSPACNFIRSPYSNTTYHNLSTLSDSTCCDESRCSFIPGFGDIITNPMEKLVFSTGYRETKSITISNISSENIMWALKSNAVHRIIAVPTCGVIPSGAQIEIKLALHTNVQWMDGDTEDKVAINYIISSELFFNKAFLSRSDKKRHLLRINYE